MYRKQMCGLCILLLVPIWSCETEASFDYEINEEVYSEKIDYGYAGKWMNFDDALSLYMPAWSIILAGEETYDGINNPELLYIALFDDFDIKMNIGGET